MRRREGDGSVLQTESTGSKALTERSKANERQRAMRLGAAGSCGTPGLSGAEHRLR